MAVRNVNLVPDELLQRRYAVRHGVGWAIAYALVIALLAGAYLLSVQRGVPRRHRLSEREVNARLATAVAQIETRKAELARLAFVRDVTCPLGPAETVGQLAELLAEDGWLTRLELELNVLNGNVLTLEGLAYSNARLGGIVNRLNESDTFQDIVLGRSSEQQTFSGNDRPPRRVVQFQITAKAVTGAQL
jgi:Tfp pilus assembly protein PilN